MQKLIFRNMCRPAKIQPSAEHRPHPFAQSSAGVSPIAHQQIIPSPHCASSKAILGQLSKYVRGGNIAKSFAQLYIRCSQHHVHAHSREEGIYLNFLQRFASSHQYRHSYCPAHHTQDILHHATRSDGNPGLQRSRC